ncbi:MAG: hypothetical protein ACREIB_08005, partial [Pseudomonadota bacterium]
MALAFDFNSLDVVAKFDGKFENRFRPGLAWAEGERRFAEAPAIAGAGDDFGFAGCGVGTAKGRHLDTAPVNDRRCKCDGQLRGLRHDGFDGRPASRKFGEASGKIPCRAVIDAIGKPDDAKRRSRLECRFKTGKQGSAIGIERLGLQGSGARHGGFSIGGLKAGRPKFRRGCGKRHRGIGPACRLDQFLQDGLALVPGCGGGPGVVHHKQQRIAFDGGDVARRIEGMR